MAAAAAVPVVAAAAAAAPVVTALTVRKPGRPSKTSLGQAPERRHNPNLCTNDCVAVNYEQQRRHRMNHSNLRAAKNREIAQLRAQALEYLARLDKCACGHT